MGFSQYLSGLKNFHRQIYHGCLPALVRLSEASCQAECKSHMLISMPPGCTRAMAQGQVGGNPAVGPKVKVNMKHLCDDM